MSFTVAPPSTFEQLEADARVLHHRVEDGARLEADRFERRAREVRLVLKRDSPTIAPRASDRQ